MNLSELQEHLEAVKEQYGDIEVCATCDGWCPPEVSVNVHTEQERAVLYGVRAIHESTHDEVEVINA